MSVVPVDAARRLGYTHQEYSHCCCFGFNERGGWADRERRGEGGRERQTDRDAGEQSYSKEPAPEQRVCPKVS